MGSYVPVDSLSVDFSQSIDETDVGECKHNFSIRGYVSETREKNWKLCWPLTVNDQSEEEPSLPPLEVPKFRFWSCRKCEREIFAEGNDQNGRRDDCNCTNSVDNSQIRRPEIDLNIAIDLFNDSDRMPIRDEIDNNAEAANRIADHEICLEDNHVNHQVSSVVPTPDVCLGLIQDGHTNEDDHEIDLENNGNHQVSTIPPPEACPDLIQEGNTSKEGCEGNGVSNMDNDTSYPKDLDKSPPYEFRNKRKSISADNNHQNHKRLRKSSRISRKAKACTIVIEEDADNNVVDDVTSEYLPPDYNSGEFSGYSCKKRQKTRSLREIMMETDPLMHEKITIQESTCPPSKKKLKKKKGQRGRKKSKSIVGKKRKHAEMEVQNKEGDATKTKRVVKGDAKTTKMKNKGIQIQEVDDNDMVSRPLHAPRTENENNILSKGKEKVVEAEEEPEYLHQSESEEAFRPWWPFQEGTSNRQHSSAEALPNGGGMEDQGQEENHIEENSEAGEDITIKKVKQSNKKRWVNEVSEDDEEVAKMMLKLINPPDGYQLFGLINMFTNQSSQSSGGVYLSQDNEAYSNTWASMSTNNAFLRHDDVTKKVVCHPQRNSTTMDMISLDQPDSLHEQKRRERDFDLNLPSTDIEQEDLNFYPGECSNRLEIGQSKVHGTPKGQSSESYKQSCPPIFGAPTSTHHHENHTSPTLFSDGTLLDHMNRFKELVRNLAESYCAINRNPADFTELGPDNQYMINGEDLKFERDNPKKKNSKGDEKH